MLKIWFQIWLSNIAVDSTAIYIWLPVKRRGTGTLLLTNLFFQRFSDLEFFPVTKFNLDLWRSHLLNFPTQITPNMAFSVFNTNYLEVVSGREGSVWERMLNIEEPGFKEPWENSNFGPILNHRNTKCFQVSDHLRTCCYLSRKFWTNRLLNYYDGSWLTFLRDDKLFSSGRETANFSLKGQRVNIFSFAGHTISVPVI